MCDSNIIKKIFPNEKDIYMSPNFIQDIVNRRLKRSFINKNLINKKEQNIEFDKLSNLKTGRYSTDIYNAHFNFFFYKGTEKKLIVCLDGARTHSGGKKRKIPIYNRWSFCNLTNASWISLEDPMYFKYKNLLLGWFYGDENNDFRYYTSLFVKKIANILGIEHNNIILYGGSGGGTAALDIACKLGNCTAISINGQYNFDYNHNNIEGFYKETKIDLHQVDKFYRNDICKILSNNSVKYIIVENCKSSWDYQSHLSFLCKKLNIIPRFGLSKFDNIYMYIYEANGKYPHTSFEDRVLFYAIYFLVEIAKKNLEIETFKNLFLLFNEFWYYKYQENNVISFIPIYDDLKLDKVDFIEDISIDASNNRYNNFSFQLQCNKKYKISIRGITVSPVEDNVSIGIYSPILHDFIFFDMYEILNNNILNFSFYIQGEAIDLKFCIFAGIHGKTNNKSMKISMIEIYTS